MHRLKSVTSRSHLNRLHVVLRTHCKPRVEDQLQHRRLEDLVGLLLFRRVEHQRTPVRVTQVTQSFRHPFPVLHVSHFEFIVFCAHNYDIRLDLVYFLDILVLLVSAHETLIEIVENHRILRLVEGLQEPVELQLELLQALLGLVETLLHSWEISQNQKNRILYWVDSETVLHKLLVLFGIGNFIDVDHLLPGRVGVPPDVIITNSRLILEFFVSSQNVN